MQLPTRTCTICCRTLAVALLPPSCSTIKRRQISEYKPSLWTTFRKGHEYRTWSTHFVDYMVNQYHIERIMAMGPDFACMEWLMNTGATCLKLSDGTQIRSQKEMRAFLATQGYDVDNLKMEAPETQILKDFHSESHFQAAMQDDVAYERRWPHISPIHLKEVDATDAVITDGGFRYFLECRRIEKLVLNHNNYFTDGALRRLSEGRPVKTLTDLEICFNPGVTDTCAFILSKFKSLRRLHMYFMPRITKRAAVARQLRSNLFECKVSFPQIFFVGLGYESEEEKAAFRKFIETEANPFQHWLNDDAEISVHQYIKRNARKRS